MHPNDTPNSTFSTSINPSLEEELFQENDGQLYALVDSSIFCDPLLTHVEVRVYALIAGYCGSAGVCFASQKTISHKAPWTDDRNFRKTCESLEKKGYLYRRQHSRLQGGSTRYLSVRCHWKKYLKFLIRKKKYELAAEVESYFTGLDKTYLAQKYRYEQSPPKPVPTEIKEKNTRGYSLPGTQRVVTTPPNISITTYRENNDVEGKTAVAEFFELALRELQVSGVTGEQLEMGRKYLEANEDLIRKKDNPVGYFIASVKKGWAADKLKLPMEQQKKEEAFQKLLNERRQLVQELIQEYSGREHGFTISHDPYHVKFIFLKDFLLPGDTNTYVPIGYKDPNFIKLVKQQKERMNACLRHSGKTGSLDESGTKGK